MYFFAFASDAILFLEKKILRGFYFFVIYEEKMWGYKRITKFKYIYQKKLINYPKFFLLYDKKKKKFRKLLKAKKWHLEAIFLVFGVEMKKRNKFIYMWHMCAYIS